METKELLKKIRTQRKLTKRDVCNGTGIPYTTYTKYEYGERELALSSLQKLADFYGVTTDYLLGRLDAEQLKEGDTVHWYETLKLLREKSGESMSKTAEFLGIPKGTYASYEYGKREPNIEMISKISHHFGVTTDYLLGREPAPEHEDLSTVVKNSGVEELEDILIRRYLELPNAQRQAVLDFLRRAIQEEADRQGIMLTKWETVKESAKNGSGTQVKSYPVAEGEKADNAQLVDDNL
ncbi:helix-turn-helix domain-containing protein [Ruminococcus callidus]|uniref:helix-turn-helix domain-containing protein n=1 Tax=Ruminococcus callidus TaxID=40519 RepID=UPI0035224368